MQIITDRMLLVNSKTFK